jgi:hypothetical protein
VQAVHRSLPLDLRRHELGPVADVPAALAELASEDRRQGFDLRQAPLMRVTLVRLPDGSHHLIWTSHHLLLDGWSAAQVMDEVLRQQAGEPVAAPAVRYRDHIAWLRARDGAGEEAFWRERLAGLDGPLHLA